MLIKDPVARISISEILEHPWITLNCGQNPFSDDDHHHFSSSAKSADTSGILSRMQSYKCDSILKKAAVRVFIDHLDPHSILELSEAFK